MRHTLGLDWAKESYRNYFESGPEHLDQPTIDQLVAKGLMKECAGSSKWWYYVTEEGMRALE